MTETNLAQALQITEGASSYDTNMKYLLADKQILARILKYAVSEFKDMAIDEIIDCISGVDIELMKGIIVNIRTGENLTESQNTLISMLEKLISKMDAEEKKRILAQEYGMIMTEEFEGRLNTMCNWSEGIIEAALKEGMEKGIIFGKAVDIIELLEDVGEVTEAMKEMIMEQDNIDIQRQWLKAAAKAHSIEDFEKAIGLVSSEKS